MRKMKLRLENTDLYESFFDPQTGNIIRRVAKFGETVDYGGFTGWRPRLGPEVRDALRERFPNRYETIASPSPELIDISITDKCNFGCTYCLVPETPVLGSDLNWRSISELSVGDELVGFDEHIPGPRQHRKLRTSRVEAVTSIAKPVLRVVTPSREVFTTGNHGWLYQGKARNTWAWTSADKLKIGHKLSLFGEPQTALPITDDYRVGYLNGMTLGDGTFRFQPGWKNWAQGFPQSYWRIALTDEEAIGRIVAYLAHFGIASQAKPFDSGSPLSKLPMWKVELRAIPTMAKLHPLLTQEKDSAEFRRGFLAGFFDAEGAHDQNLRYYQNTGEPLERVVRFARGFGYEFTKEDRSVRLVGDTYQRMKFLGLIQPAIRRKTRDWMGYSLEGQAEPILAIEKVGLRDVVDIQTSTATFVANGLATHNCYQDSRPKRQHGPRNLVSTILKGFSTVPYQIAIGGGEPCGVPDFPDILREARELGTVPNYTTAGHVFRPEVIEATNAVCGGVAVTYHSFKGFDWFETTYRKWQEALKCQVNIHLIADKDVAKNLDELVRFQDRLGKTLNVVLLAYYPDVGRATMDSIMTRRIYSKALPDAIVGARAKGVGIAFSEGLLPFFLSRPEMGINTQFATRSEGVFSCYISPKGIMQSSSFGSSFDKGDKHQKSVFEESSQKLWDELRVWSTAPSGEACYGCKYQDQCSAPSSFHYFNCAFATHNKLPLKTVKEDV